LLQNRYGGRSELTIRVIGENAEKKKRISGPLSESRCSDSKEEEISSEGTSEQIKLVQLRGIWPGYPT